MRFAGSSYKMKDMTPKKSYPVLKNQLHTGHKPLHSVVEIRTCIYEPYINRISRWVWKAPNPFPFSVWRYKKHGPRARCETQELDSFSCENDWTKWVSFQQPWSWLPEGVTIQQWIRSPWWFQMFPFPWNLFCCNHLREHRKQHVFWITKPAWIPGTLSLNHDLRWQILRSTFPSFPSFTSGPPSTLQHISWSWYYSCTI